MCIYSIHLPIFKGIARGGGPGTSIPPPPSLRYRKKRGPERDNMISQSPLGPKTGKISFFQKKMLRLSILICISMMMMAANADPK